MSEHEVSPLTGAEAQSLRAIAQELTRTDPRLLRPVRADHGRRPLPGPIGASVFISCVLVGAVATAIGVLFALVVGVVLILGGIVVLTARCRRGRDR